MSKQVARYDITEQLYIYKQDNSTRWYARFVLYGKWYSRTTKQKDKQEAITIANHMFIENKIKLENNVPIHVKRFTHIADLAIAKMKRELEQGIGHVVYKDYISALNKYHKEFFKREYITSIDQQMLINFDTWRIKEAKRHLAHSTILNHNAAMNRVFDEAVRNKWLMQSNVPKLSNNGVQGKQISAFTEEEFSELIRGFGNWYANSRNGRTKLIRELLYDYMLFAVYTGMRPGTEIDSLTWSDLRYKKDKRGLHLLVSVRKGKTTKYTGTRKIVCQYGAKQAIKRLKDRFPNAASDDLIFRCSDGSKTNELSKAFNGLLAVTGLKEDAYGKRVLYSLRHSYITWMLLKKKNINMIAAQCGNSAKTIDENYNHLVPEMNIPELDGSMDNDLEGLIAAIDDSDGFDTGSINSLVDQ